MQRIRVNVFPGMANIPIFAARETGAFAREDLEVEVQATPSSLAQRAALAEGVADLAHAAFDDVIAGVEDAALDFAAVWGGDGGFQALYSHPSVSSPAGLAGRTVAVDDPVTAYALVLRAVLRRAGVAEPRYEMRPVGSTARRFAAIRDEHEAGVKAGVAIAASMLAPPYSVMAEDLGWRRLGSPAELLGAYQGTVAFCRRAWAAANRALLARYRRALLEGLDWALAAANRESLAAIVARELSVPLPVARRSCAIAIDLPGGLDPRAAFDFPGMRQVIALRAEVLGQWAGSAPDAARYLAPVE